MSKSKHPRPSRYELTQTQWERIEDLLPGKASDPGRVAVDKRSFVNGVLWVLRSGARWSDLPPRYGAYKSAHKRFTRWAAKGIWEQVFQSLICDRSNEYLMIDSSIVRAHAQAATAKRGGLRTRLWGAAQEVCARRSTWRWMARAERCDLSSLAGSATTSRKPQRCWPDSSPKVRPGRQGL